jgi:hypothetical protein
MTDERPTRSERTDQTKPEAKPRASRADLKDRQDLKADRRDSLDAQHKAPAAEQGRGALPCWPFPVGSQNETDKAVKLKPYVPPKRRTLNQY